MITEAQKNQIIADMLAKHGGRSPETPDTTSDEKIASIHIRCHWCDELEKMLNDCDRNGHWGGDSAQYSIMDHCHTTGFGLLLGCEPDFVFELYHAWLTNTPIEPVRLGKEYNRFSCTECAKEVHFVTDGTKIWVEEPCSEAGGIKPFTTHLNVPSGKIVMANDLRNLYEDMEEIDSDDMCTRAGLRGICKDYERVGLVHGFCGNSDVELFEKDGGYVLDYQKNMGKKKSLAPLTTDLWWYCFADQDDFLKRKGDRKKNYREFVFEVEPGVYEFTHYGHLGNNDSKLSQKVEFKRISSF